MKRTKNVGRTQERGFTLAELMVVIVIIGLLATVVVPNVVGYLFRAKRGVAEQQVANLEAAIKQFLILNNGKYPDSLDDLVKKDQNNQSFLDSDVVPLDPWGNPFFYHVEGSGNAMEVGTYGADGQPGGEGDNADITNKTIHNKAGEKKN